jgi:hypothetical protein
MVWKLKSTIETRKRNNQSKNKFPIYKNTDLLKKNVEISCWIRNEKYMQIYSHIQWENAVDRSIRWRKSSLFPFLLF